MQLKCKDAAAAMEMLQQSERIEQDMRLAINVFEKRGHWKESLVIREWQDIDVSQEWVCGLSGE